MSDSRVFGELEVRRVLEWVGPVLPVDAIFPGTPGQVWRDNVQC